MTNAEILGIAMRQSATDLNCTPSDFRDENNVITVSRKSAAARKYLELPFECNLVTYGENVVASVREDLIPLVREYIGVSGGYRLFESPELTKFEAKLNPLGLGVCFMAEYFLPDIEKIKILPCGFEIKIINPPFYGLYKKEWSNALCKQRKNLDVMAVGAYDGNKLIGLAGASADCADMYQIGVDVLRGYRKRGVGSALTSRLTAEILKAGKVPFYCAAWSNIKSVKNAIKCGYYPAWIELTVKSAEYIGRIKTPPKE